MAQTKAEIRSILDAANTHPRHRFGQNFMIDGNLVRAVADAGRCERGGLVVEVGPGTGTLSDELLARDVRLLAIEIDRDLAATLRQRFAGNDRFTLLEGDALASKHALHAELLAALASEHAAGRSTRLVANLPYNIASPLVIELLLAGVDTLAFTVQREVADRFRAKAGDDAYGPLSVIAQSLGDVEVLRVLPPQAFWPAPTIESALVRITRKPTDFDGAAFGAFVQRLFAYRRKTMRKALREAGTEIVVPDEDAARRPETFSPAALLTLWGSFETRGKRNEVPQMKTRISRKNASSS